MRTEKSRSREKARPKLVGRSRRRRTSNYHPHSHNKQPHSPTHTHSLSLQRATTCLKISRWPPSQLLLHRPTNPSTPPAHHPRQPPSVPLVILLLTIHHPNQLTAIRTHRLQTSPRIRTRRRRAPRIVIPIVRRLISSTSSNVQSTYPLVTRLLWKLWLRIKYPGTRNPSYTNLPV